MSPTLDQFLQTLTESGLMTEDEVQSFLAQLPDDQRPADSEQLARQLYRGGKLTRFQAHAVYRGRTKGLILGDYIVLDELGEGGMGQVYKAQHRQMKRTVAIKILPPELTRSETARQRFQQEVETAARLFHPHIVTALDAGTTRGVHYLVMEYVKGEDLDRVVSERGPLAVADALNYTLQTARGLEYAHQQGVIHRDIKPSNLLLATDGTVKILDMGLARVDHSGQFDATHDCGMTQSGEVMGTVDYMSPEQAASTKHVDKRTDMYSLGCTLFFLLNQRPVFGGETAVARIMAHRDKPPPALHKIRSDVSASLDAVFRRMVSKKPEYRYASMSEVISQLEKCQVPGGGRRPPASSARQPAAPPAAAMATTALSSSTRHGEETDGEETDGGAPPPPELTARNRAPRQRPPESRRKRAMETANRVRRESQHRQAWHDTVQAAVKEQKRKKLWQKIGRLANAALASTVKWVLLVGLLAGTGVAGFFVWQNQQRLDNSQERVLQAINSALEQRGLERLNRLSFIGASTVQPVPDTLAFERAVFSTESGGRRQAATLVGQFDRQQGVVRITSPFRGEWKVEPVP